MGLNVAAEWLHQLSIVLLAEIENLKAKQYDPCSPTCEGAKLTLHTSNMDLVMEVMPTQTTYRCTIKLNMEPG